VGQAAAPDREQDVTAPQPDLRGAAAGAHFGHREPPALYRLERESEQLGHERRDIALGNLFGAHGELVLLANSNRREREILARGGALETLEEAARRLERLAVHVGDDVAAPNPGALRGALRPHARDHRAARARRELER